MGLQHRPGRFGGSAIGGEADWKPTLAGSTSRGVARVRAGNALLPGQEVTLDRWPRRIIPEMVPNPGQIAFPANHYYQRPEEHSVPVLQLSFDHDDGRFPWDDRYAGPEQPRPGTFQA